MDLCMLSNQLKKTSREFKALLGDPLLLIIITLIFVSLAIFIIFPLARVIMASFQSTPGGPFTLDVFRDVISSNHLRLAFWNSIMMGVLTAVTGCAVGFLFAYSIARTDMPLKKFFHTMAIIPIVSPPFIGAMAIIMLFGNNGLITFNLLGIINFPIFGFRGLFMAQVITFFPVAYITLRGVIESISPTLEDAALDLGGSKWKVFYKVTLPLAAPGIASAMLVLFIESLSDFGNPLILAGAHFPVLSVQAFLEITGMHNLPRGSAIAFLLLGPAMTAYFLQKYWVSRKQYVTITGKPTNSTLKSVTPLAKWILFGFCLLIAAFILLVYATIVWGAFARVWGFDATPTLEHFRFVFSVGFRAINDTLIIAGISTPLAGILGMIIAFLVVRKNFPGKKLMEFSSMLSFALPGTVIGIGYILAFNQAPFLLTGTLAILVLHFIFRFIPVGIQSGVAILQQVDPSIEEAAIDMGADSRKTFFKITLPLMIPAFFSGLLFSFVRAMTAVSAAIFLVSPRWRLMTVQIMSQVESGRLGSAAAFSLILVGLILIAIFIIRTTLLALYGKAGGKMLNI